MMFRIVCSLVMGLLMSTSAKAASADEICPTIADLAESIIRVKQEGKPLQTVLASIAKNTEANAQSKIIFRNMILDAYSLPDFQSEQYKEQQVREYVLESVTHCYNAFEK